MDGAGNQELATTGRVDYASDDVRHRSIASARLCTFPESH
jgi:hypothetical protein